MKQDGYLLESKIHTFSKNYAQALSLCKIARKSLPTHLHHSLKAVQLAQAEADILYTRALHTQSISDWDQAAVAFDSAISHLKHFQAGLHHEEAVGDWQVQMIEIFEKAMKVQDQLATLTEVPRTAHNFAIMEQYRAAILCRALLSTQTKELENLPTEILTKESELKREINICQQMLYSTKRGREAPDSLLAVIVERQEQLSELKHMLRQEHQSYYEMRYGVNSLMTLTDFQAYLGKEKATAIEFMVGQKQIHALVISPDSAWQFALELNEIEPILADLVQGISDTSSVIHRSPRAYSEISYEIYQYLLEESLTHLSDSIKRLIFMPDQVLASIPFAALVSKPSVLTDDFFANLQYVFDEYVVSYTPSAHILISQNRPPEREQKVLAVAPTFEDPLAKLEELPSPSVRNMSHFLLRNTGELTHNIPEAQQVVGQVGGEVLHGSEATKASFLANCHSYSILHLPTHTTLDSLEESLHNLQFYDLDPDEDFDDLLFAREIYELDLNQTDLVVLSACQSASGTYQRGEGVMSLTRAFQQAGAASVMASLWQVDDRSTYEIMTAFYEYLGQGKRKDQALGEAMREFLDQHPNSSPFLWAAFTSHGNQQTLPFSSMMNWWTILGVWGGIFLLLFVGRQMIRQGRISR